MVQRQYAVFPKLVYGARKRDLFKRLLHTKNELQLSSELEFTAQSLKKQTAFLSPNQLRVTWRISSIAGDRSTQRKIGSGNSNGNSAPAGHDEWLRRQREMDKDLDRIEAAQAEERRTKAAKMQKERAAKEKAEIATKDQAQKTHGDEWNIIQDFAKGRLKEITVVLLELNGNQGLTFKLKRDLHQLQPQALREHICGRASLPKSWSRDCLSESDLAGCGSRSVEAAKTYQAL